MKILLLAGWLTASCIAQEANNYREIGPFESPDRIVAAVRSVDLTKRESPLASLFAYPKRDASKTVRYAETIVSCTVVWKKGDDVLVFANGSWSSKAERGYLGVLILVKRSGDQWSISDAMRFLATGTKSSLRCERTGNGGNWVIVQGPDSGDKKYAARDGKIVFIDVE